MVSRSYVILLILFLIAGCAGMSEAQPAWDVNPYAYEFSMTITARVTTDGHFSENVNDRVAAFIKGQCRGVSNVKYESSADGYYVYLMVFSNKPGDTITFKIFDASSNEVVNAKISLYFTINKITGSLDSPVIISSEKLSNEARLIGFSIPDQVGETTFSGKNVNVQMSPNSSLAGINASFLVSEGAKVFINGVKQESGKTVNDFVQPRQYTVVSADFSDTVVYTVYISSKSNKPPVFISNPGSYVLQDDIYIYPVVVSDPEGDKITISMEDLPSWLTFNAFTGIITGVAHNDQVGMFSFKIRATDGLMESVQNVIIQVINKNDPPEIKSIFGNQIFYINKDNELELPKDCIIDPDAGDMLIFSLSLENNAALPQWLSFNPVTLKISGKPPLEAQGTYHLKLTATDPAKLKEWIVFELKVDMATLTRTIDMNPDFRIYPNPFRNELFIDIPEGKAELQISVYTGKGQLWSSFTWIPGSLYRLNTEALTPGFYLIALYDGLEVRTKRIVKY
jgi:hypothetical protein